MDWRWFEHRPSFDFWQFTPEMMAELCGYQEEWVRAGIRYPELTEYVVRDAEYIANREFADEHQRVVQYTDIVPYDRTPMGLLHRVLLGREFYLHLHLERDQYQFVRYFWHDLSPAEQLPFRNFSKRVKSRSKNSDPEWVEPFGRLEAPRDFCRPVPPPLLAVPFLQFLLGRYHLGPRRITCPAGEQQELPFVYIRHNVGPSYFEEVNAHRMRILQDRVRRGEMDLLPLIERRVFVHARDGLEVHPD